MLQGLILGIDLGTQSIKVGVYTSDGECVLNVSASYPTYHTVNGYAEQQANDWWNALKQAMQQVSKEVDINQIQGIALCATSSTVLLTTNELEPIGMAQCWMDQRSSLEEEEINASQNQSVIDVLRYSGGKTSIEWMLTKSLWLKKNRELTTERIVEQIDWMNYKLTGKLVASRCNVTCKWGYIKSNGGFSEKFLKEIGLEDIRKHWPDNVLQVGDLVGYLTNDSSNDLGLVGGIPVFQGGIDAHIGMIGAKALEPGNLSMTTGTSFVHLMHHEDSIFNSSLWGPYDSPLVDRLWLLEGGQLSCGSIISWFLKEFYDNTKDTGSIFQELEREIKEIAPGSNGLTILDSWKGNRTPYKTPYATGVFFGLTLSHTKYHIYRAILEAIAFGTKNVIKTFEESSIPVRRIIAGGGGTKNESWMQIISDVTGVPVDIPKDQETGTRGAAIIAAYGLGKYNTLIEASNEMVEMQHTYHPDEKNTEIYNRLFETYLELNELLFPLMEKEKRGGEK